MLLYSQVKSGYPDIAIPEIALHDLVFQNMEKFNDRLAMVSNSSTENQNVKSLSIIWFQVKDWTFVVCVFFISTISYRELQFGVTQMNDIMIVVLYCSC